MTENSCRRRVRKGTGSWGRCPGFSRGSHTPNRIVSPWRLEHLEHWTTAAWSSANFTCVSGEPSRPSGRTPPDGSVAAAPRQPSRAPSFSKPRLPRRSASAASSARSRTRPGPDQSPLPAPADLGHVEKVRNGLLLLILHVAVPPKLLPQLVIPKPPDSK